MLGGEAYAFEAAVGYVLDVFCEEVAVEAEDAVGEDVPGVGDFEFHGFVDFVEDALLEFGGPQVGVFGFDAVDEVDAEVEVDGFVSEDILELFSDACHTVLAVEAEDHDEAGVEEDAFHDDVVADEVFEELLGAVEGFGGEVVGQDGGGEFHLEGVFSGDGGDFAVHVEDFFLVEPEGFYDVEEGVGVDGFFEGLAEEVLAAFGVGDVFEDGEDEVVADEGLGGGEEAEVSHDDEAFVGGEGAGGFPGFDVFGHGDFGGHPVVGAAVDVVFPGPFVFEGHELVDVDLVAVDEAFGVDGGGGA